MSRLQYQSLCIQYPTLRNFIMSCVVEKKEEDLYDLLFGLCHNLNGDVGIVNA